ncbi:hypothetical protein [Nostoc sp.]
MKLEEYFNALAPDDITYDLTVLLLPNFVQSIDTYQTELYSNGQEA